VVGTAATRGLHRSSMSKVNWEGKGPSSPLGGAICCAHDKFMVMSYVHGGCVYV
jgi:hypothetical protein